MLFSEAKGRKVVSTATAETIAKVSDFVVDPATRSVVAIKVKKAKSGDTVRWDTLTAFGVDAVTLPSEDLVTEPDSAVAALSGKHHRLVGRRVLTSRGDELGDVQDVEFDATTGALTALLLRGGSIDGARLVGVGSYAVVVEHE